MQKCDTKRSHQTLFTRLVMAGRAGQSGVKRVHGELHLTTSTTLDKGREITEAEDTVLSRRVRGRATLAAGAIQRVREEIPVTQGVHNPGDYLDESLVSDLSDNDDPSGKSSVPFHRYALMVPLDSVVSTRHPQAFFVSFSREASCCIFNACNIHGWFRLMKVIACHISAGASQLPGLQAAAAPAVTGTPLPQHPTNPITHQGACLLCTDLTSLGLSLVCSGKSGGMADLWLELWCQKSCLSARQVQCWHPTLAMLS